MGLGRFAALEIRDYEKKCAEEEREYEEQCIREEIEYEERENRALIDYAARKLGNQFQWIDRALDIFEQYTNAYEKYVSLYEQDLEFRKKEAQDDNHSRPISI